MRIIDDYRRHLLGHIETGRFSHETAANTLSTARSWLTWAYETERIENLPRNLRRMRINRVPSVPQVFKAEELRHIIRVADDRNRLYLLLMLNCGAYGSDIGLLKPDEVDWNAGRITRKQTKTSHHGSAPTTNYLLWDETLRLLVQFRSTNPERVILSAKGEPLWDPRIENGRLIEVDHIRHSLKRLFNHSELRELVGTRSARHLRKSGASLLKTSENFHDLDVVYLAHAPTGVAAKHYSQEPQVRFDEAVRWLGQQLGFETSIR